MIKTQRTPGAARQQGARRRHLRSLLTAGMFLAPYTIFFLAFLAWPIVYGFYISLHTWSLFTKSGAPFIGLRNYQTLMSDQVWWNSLENTIEFTVITVVLMFVVALGAALLVNANL